MSRKFSKGTVAAVVVAAVIAGLCLAAFYPALVSAQWQLGRVRAASRASDEIAMRQAVANFNRGWNTHDAHLMCSVLADDGMFVTWRGQTVHGRAQFEKLHVGLFAGIYSHVHRTDEVRNIRFLTPRIASVDDFYTMTGAKRRDGSDWPYRAGYFNFLMVNRNGRWEVVISHAADFNAKAPAAAETAR